jgi:hypothetical protein
MENNSKGVNMKNNFLKKVLVCLLVLIVSSSVAFATSISKSSSLMVDGVDIEEVLNKNNGSTKKDPSASKPKNEPAKPSSNGSSKPAPMPAPKPPKPTKPAPKPEPKPPKPPKHEPKSKTVVIVKEPVKPVVINTVSAIPPAYTYSPAYYPTNTGTTVNYNSTYNNYGSSTYTYSTAQGTNVYTTYGAGGIPVREIRLGDTLFNNIANNINATRLNKSKVRSLKTFTLDPSYAYYQKDAEYLSVYLPLSNYGSQIYVYNSKYGVFEEAFYRFSDTGVVELLLSDTLARDSETLLIIAGFDV